MTASLIYAAVAILAWRLSRRAQIGAAHNRLGRLGMDR